MSDLSDNCAVDKKGLIRNVVKFLRFEAEGSSLDKKESIEIAIQCLEAAYNTQDDQTEPKEYDKFLTLFQEPSVDEPIQCVAETCKITGNDLMKIEKYQDALEQYNQAIKLCPNNAVYYCNRAATCIKLNKYHEALQDCQQAIKLNSNYDKAYGRLGIAYSHLEMHAEAREAFKKAINLDPENNTYQDNLKLAEKQIQDNLHTTPNFPISFNEFMASSNLMNMASEILNNSRVCDLMSGLARLAEHSGLHPTDLVNNQPTPMPTQLDGEAQFNNGDEHEQQQTDGQQQDDKK